MLHLLCKNAKCIISEKIIFNNGITNWNKILFVVTQLHNIKKGCLFKIERSFLKQLFITYFIIKIPAFDSRNLFYYFSSSNMLSVGGNQLFSIESLDSTTMV